MIDVIDLSERELRWLDEELGKSTAAWKIVAGHYQMYSATRGDNDAGQDDLVHRLQGARAVWGSSSNTPPAPARHNGARRRRKWDYASRPCWRSSEGL